VRAIVASAHVARGSRAPSTSAARARAISHAFARARDPRDTTALPSANKKEILKKSTKSCVPCFTVLMARALCYVASVRGGG
jgi:hypothetical protein